MIWFALEAVRQHRFIRFFRVIEDNSFQIFLFHQQWIYVFTVILNGRVNWLIQIFVTFILSIVCSLIIIKLFYMNALIKKELGG